MIGQKLGSFRIEAELGSGAMGVVYRGFNEVKNKPAAIKVISLEQMGKGRAMDRFIREAEILEQFRHPNIVRYLARGRSGGKHYYAMEYITGPTLDKVLSERATLPWREVVALGVQLCEALQYSHERGVVHRDLKPSNLMITETGQLKLTDFGIAKDLDATALTGTGRTLGTATYMAPEQIRGTPEISHKTDLYSLGAVFYHFLTGVPPYSGQTALVMMHAHINEPPKRPSDKVEEIPKVLDDLVVALMAKAPQDRPWDAEAVAQVLRELLDKASRQETIKMAWPEKGSPASMPTRADMIDPTLIPKKRTKGSKKKPARETKSTRERLEVAGLVAGLILVAALIAYVVWPPGQDHLFRKAEALMASPEASDWILAQEHYLDPLDSRFPKHPYREKTEAWRDRIALRDAERRARLLEQVNLVNASQPKGDAEAFYQNTFKEAEAASKRRDDRDAEALWRSMEKNLSGEGKENRGWVLLASARAEAVAKIIRRRRETVESLMTKAMIPPQLAQNDLARKNSREILRDVVARFDDYSDVADQVAQARAALEKDGEPHVQSPPATAPPKEPPPKS
jgi:eukaryotic-like serine/threonine-protein kinase